MPNNNITINPNSGGVHPGELMGLVNALSQCLARLEQIKATMDNATDGTNWATLENLYAIPTGKGQTVYNLVAGSLSELQADTNTLNLINWLGATR